MRRFELREGTASKFWQIVVDGATYKVTFGKIGSNGQTQIKRFADEATAKLEADEVIAEKTKKGYAEVGGSPAATPAPAPEAKPAPKQQRVQGWQFVHPNGQVALPGPYENAHGFREGVANVRVAGKWGMIDREGSFVVPPQHFVVWPSHQHRAGFCPTQGTKWGFLDPTGAVVIEPSFGDITNFDIKGVPLARFSLDKKWGALRTDGSAFVPAEWDGISVGRDGWVRVVRGGLSGFIDAQGNQVIECKFKCDNFQEDRALVNVGGKFGFIDRRGEMVIEPVYENGGGFFEGGAWMKKDGNYGWIDPLGRVVIPFQYDGAVEFAEGRAFVWEGSKVHCIDRAGKKVSRVSFGDGNAFEHGLAIVGKGSDGPFGLVDKDCNVILPLEYESIDGVGGLHRKVGKKTQHGVRYGYVDLAGNVVCEPQFLGAQPLPEDLAAVETMIVATEVPVQPSVHATPSVIAAADEDDSPRLLVTKAQIHAHASLRKKPELADRVISVAKDPAAIRKLLRVEENLAQVSACPYFWLEALGVDAVAPLEVALELLRAESRRHNAWSVPAPITEGLSECTGALDLISSFACACARVRLFGVIPQAEKHLARSLRALAIAAGAPGPQQEDAAQSFATLEGEHPGSVEAALATIPGEELAAFRSVAVNRGIGLPEASGDEIPKTVRPSEEKSKKKTKLPDHWHAIALARPLLVGRKKALPLAAVDEIAVRLENDALDVAELRAACDAQSLRDFGWSVFSSWLDARANAKQKWALTMLGDFGDDEIALRLAPLIAEWPGQSAHARAVIGLSVLGSIGTDTALRAIYRLSQRAKFGGLKGEAQSAIARIAKQRGLTQEELADRLVPDFDLDPDGSTTLDFGPRSFRVGFDEGLKPYVIDADGKRIDDLPKPKQTDDGTRAAEAHATWKTLKKEVRAIASMQVERLEKAMCARRLWHADAFRLYFVEHPLLQHLAHRLVWGIYEGDKLARTFRVAEDSTLADATDGAVTLPREGAVGIVHALDLDERTTTSWSQVLADYELVQPFKQLGREVYAMTDEERGSHKVRRFVGRVVKAGSLLGLLSRGWSRGPAQDNGVVYELYHPLGGTLGLDPGIYFAPGAQQEDQKLGEVTLPQSDPLAFSELVRSLEMLAP